MLKIKVIAELLVIGLLCATPAAYGEGPAFDVRPTPIKTPPPEYPYSLRRDGISGIVAVKVEIDENGAVTNCSVTKSSNSGFDDAAVKAVKTWKFKPAQKDGSPVKISLVIPIKFNIEES